MACRLQQTQIVMLLDGLQAAADTNCDVVTWPAGCSRHKMAHAFRMQRFFQTYRITDVGIAEAVRGWHNCDPLYSRNMLQL
jgi:hypothetical protein